MPATFQLELGAFVPDDPPPGMEEHFYFTIWANNDRWGSMIEDGVGPFLLEDAKTKMTDLLDGLMPDPAVSDTTMRDIEIRCVVEAPL